MVTIYDATITSSVTVYFDATRTLYERQDVQYPAKVVDNHKLLEYHLAKSSVLKLNRKGN